MSTYLLDANVLIALSVAEHEHHDRASDWLATVPAFAVCPVAEGALVRFLLRMGESATTTAALLERVRAHPRCHFWPDDRDIPVFIRSLSDRLLVPWKPRVGPECWNLDVRLFARPAGDSHARHSSRCARRSRSYPSGSPSGHRCR